MLNMIGLTFIYMGFFIKIYVLKDQITYLYIAPISICPTIFMYVYEMCSEVAKDRANWSKKSAHIKS